jgi:Ca-activated chloride channel family protein
MRGQPLEQSKKAIRFALENLTENDSFQIIQFSNTFQSFGPNPLPGTRENIKRVLSYLDRLEGVGGEQMTEGLSAALNFPHDEERLRFVCLMTDGRIGNEADILREIKPKIGPARIFSFGVGSSPNRFLLNRLALAGRGVSAFLGYDGDPDLVMQKFLSYVRGAALTDLEIDWKVDPENVDFYPSTLPDVFRGRSVHVLARIQGEASETIQLKGKLGGTDYSMDIKTQISSGAKNPLKPFWAKARIADLSESMLTAYSRETIELIASQIRETAIANHILSPLTTYEVINSAPLPTEDSGIEDSAPDSID